MNPAIIKAVCEEVVGALRVPIDALARGLDEVRAMVRDIPAGAPGVGIKSIAQAADHASADIEFDNGTVIEIQLPPGPQGEKGETGQSIQGERGEPGQAPSAAEVAALLRALPDFVQAATPEALQAEPWKAGIYRAGTLVAHYIGRLYCAEKDTTAEPGDSTDWRRIGTAGLRLVGGYSDARLYEPGDLYAKNASTFLYDGSQHRLLFAKPYTAGEAERDIAKEVAKAIAPLVARQVAELATVQAVAIKALEDVAHLREQLQELLE
jgi:hypothetical protein